MTTLLVGGYGPEAGGTARGVGRLELDADGGLEWTGTIAEAASPSWLHVLPGRRDEVLLAVGESNASLSWWRAEGSALGIGGRVAAGGDGPCHLAAAPDAVLVSCYGGGVLGSVPLIDGAPAADAEVALRGTGSGPHRAQEAAHVHASLRLADGRVLVADLGTDEVHVLRRDGADRSSDPSPGGLSGAPVEAPGAWRRIGAIAFAPGSGPRDLTLLDDGRVAVLTELSCEVVLLDTRPEIPVPADVVPMPGAREGDHAAGIAAVPAVDGLTLHVGLRGSDLVGAVRVAGPRLEPIGAVASGVAWPRHLVATGRYLLVAGQNSGTVAVHRTGAALPLLLGEIAVPTPTHLLPVASSPWAALPALDG